MAIPRGLAQLFLDQLIDQLEKTTREETDGHHAQLRFHLWGISQFEHARINPDTSDAIQYLTAAGASLSNSIARTDFAHHIGLPMLQELVRLGFDVNTKLGASKSTLASRKIPKIMRPDEVFEYLLRAGARINRRELDCALPRVRQRALRILVGRSLKPLLCRVSADIVRLVLGHLKE